MLSKKVASVVVLLAACGLAGCMDSLEKQGKKTGSIIGKKTDDIAKFDAKQPGQQVSDSKVRADDPLLYGMQAYGPIVEQISKLNIDYAVRVFEAEHGRYPKDYEEFMEKIIKANQIKLPVLPGGWRYAYDVENHKLEVVKPENAKPGPFMGKDNPPAFKSNLPVQPGPGGE